MVSLLQIVSGLLSTSGERALFKEAASNMTKLQTVLASLLPEQHLEFKGNTDIEVAAIAYDSRKVSKDSLFVCIPGLKSDGHDFAEQAVKQGAVALVVERFLALPVTQIKVADSRQALGLMAAAFYGWPTQKLRMCGVTGTNGKTTVTHLIEQIFAKSGQGVGLIGTLGARIGEKKFPGSRTTPEASDVQELLGTMVDNGAKYAVMEVSSHALDLHRVNGCEYDIAVFTNLTQDHLDYHKTMEEYLAAKSKLFSGLGSGSKSNKLAVINADDSAAAKLLAKTPVRAVTYSIKEKADYQAINIVNRLNGVEFEVTYPTGRLMLRLKTPGMFSVYNALAAFAVGIEEGIPAQLVAEALEEVKGVPGRFELVDDGQPFAVIVDYAHTPDGLENVLNTAREFVSGKIICVFGCGGDRDRTKRPLMGEIAARLADVVIITSDNPRSEEPEAIIEDIKPGVEQHMKDYVAVPDRKAAIMLACSKARPGDIILIAGKGHEDYQLIKGEVLSFDDRLVAKQCLGRLGPWKR